jgi:sigma-B regulation protein RsbU (phosphoserine phosphatase)
MQLRKLYRTIESIGSRPFENAAELLRRVLEEVVRNEEIKINGGRAWKFNPRSGSYVLLHQVGDMEPIEPNYQVKIKDYPVFTQLAEVRTVLAQEQNEYLRGKGILHYSATGIGDKIQWRGYTLYPFVLAFNADRLDENLPSTLNIISTAVSTVLRSRKLERRAEDLKRDLDKARDIQRSILPQHEISFHSYGVYGLSIPDRIVGGDFFDYLQVEGDLERLGIVIGDAASKGVSAAVEALYASGALRMGFEFQTKMTVLLSRVNKLLHKTFSEEHFISLFYMELTDDRNGLVLYANCGHNNPVFLRSHTSEPEFLEATGQLLGPFPNEKFKTASIFMGKGDVLLLYTDGISEATNEQGEAYGEDRLVSQLVSMRSRTPKEIAGLIIEDVEKFNTLGTLTDDKTVVVIKRLA